MHKLAKPILWSVVYTAIMGIGWIINPHPYGNIENVIFMIPVLIVLSLLSLLLLKKNSIKLKESKTTYSTILYLFIGLLLYLALTNLIAFQSGGNLGPIDKIGALLITTLLVGLAEEGFYRGYVLNTIERKIGVRKALFYSSILFGLLHSVNFLAGPTIGQTIAQVLLTSAIGYVFGVIYIKSNRNLILVMILHGIYDFFVFNITYLSELNNYKTTATLAIPMLLILWIYSLLISKKEIIKTK